VKRLLPAFIIALAIHGLILGIPFERLSQRRFETNQKRSITMTFTYRQPSPIAEPKHPPQPEAKPPAKALVVPSQQAKPQPPVVKPQVPRKPVSPPSIPPQPAPLEPTSVPEQAVQPPSTRTEAPPITKPVGAIVAPLTTDNDRSAAKDTVAPPVREARPLYRQNPPPRYPRSARRRGYEGSVLLEVKVLKDGSVGDLRVLTSSGHSVLDKAAVKSVRKWVFEPGMRGDQKVDMWVRVPIRFRIE